MAIKDRDALKGMGPGGLTNPNTGQVDTRPNYSIRPSQTAQILADIIDSALFGVDLSGVDVTATHDPTTNAITLALSAAVSRRLLGDGAISDGTMFASDIVPEGALAPDVRAGLFEGIRAVLNQNGDLVITIEGGGGHEEQTDPLTLPTSQGEEGDAGWSPRFSVRADGERRVLYLEGYVGGEGSAPAINARFVGASGYVLTAAAATNIRGGTGAKGDTGDVGGRGAPGASAAARYRRTTTSTPPAAPTSDSDAEWAETYTAPDATNDFAWLAFRVGTGAWAVILVSQHQAASGGTTPPAQDHTIYLAYGATQSQTVFTGADFENAARARNNSADTSVNTITPAPLTPEDTYRHYAGAIPTDRRLTELYIGNNPINQRSTVNPQLNQDGSADANAPPTVPINSVNHKYYVSTRPVNNTGEAWRFVTEAV